MLCRVSPGIIWTTVIKLIVCLCQAGTSGHLIIDKWGLVLASVRINPFCKHSYPNLLNMPSHPFNVKVFCTFNFHHSNKTVILNAPNRMHSFFVLGFFCTLFHTPKSQRLKSGVSKPDRLCSGYSVAPNIRQMNIHERNFSFVACLVSSHETHGECWQRRA